MKKIIVLIVMTVALISLPARALDTMPVDEIKAGMEGKGYSVFSGGEPEEFGVRIIGVVENAMADQDMILAELSGQNLEESGIIAGMSGSPVYIDGKMIGAVAYAWPWAKRPIAGITPIADMTEIWNQMDATDGSAESSSSLIPRRDSVAMVDAPGYGKISMAPISTPLYMSGFGAKATAYLEENLSAYGIVPMQGGGTAGDEDVPGMNDLQPGSVISIQMVSGDFTTGAIGTVTAREGDRLLAFGHPFMGMGKLSVPMGGGSIVTVMPVQSVSFKMGNMGKQLGALNRDNQAAIAGTIGGKANTFPLNITVNAPDTGRSEEFHLQIAQIDELIMQMLAISVIEATDRVAGGGHVTVSHKVEGKFRDFDRRFHFEDTYFSPSGAMAFYTLGKALSLWGSHFRKNEFEEINIEITVDQKEMYAYMNGFTLDKSEIHPGDTVTAYVRLLPRVETEQEMIKEIKFDIPADAPEGIYRLLMLGGGYDDGPMTLARPRNFDQWVDFLEDWIPGNSIVVALQYPGQAIGLEGYEAQGLPDTLQGTLVKDLPHNMNLIDRFMRKIVKTDSVIEGNVQQMITVTREY